jgi:calcium-dependent protein kinase
MYILLCGYPPFNGKNDEEIIEKIKTGSVKFDPKKWDNISEDAKELILSMIKLDEASRITAQ